MSTNQHSVPLSLKIGLGLILIPALICFLVLLYCGITHTPTNTALIMTTMVVCLVLGVIVVVFSQFKPSDLVTEFFNDISKTRLTKKSASKPPAPAAPLSQAPPYQKSLPNMRGARSVANSKAPETSH